MRERMDIKQRLDDRYRAGSMTAAGIILASVAKYGGERSLLVQWARLTTSHVCEIVAGGDPCCACGLAAYPGHRAELAEGTFCSSCCPICRDALTANGSLQTSRGGLIWDDASLKRGNPSTANCATLGRSKGTATRGHTRRTAYRAGVPSIPG